MTTISRTSSWTAATSGPSPSNTPKYPSKARGRRRAAGGGARRPKKSPKLGRNHDHSGNAAFSAIFERRVLSDLSLCKGDVRPRVSAIATAKTATKKRKKCHKSHSQNRTHFQILLQRLVNYRYRLRDVV